MIDSDKSFLFENDHLVELGDVKTALIDADGIIQSAKNKKQNKLLVNAQINKARILLQLGNIKDAYQLASNSLTLSDSTQEAVEAFNIMGYCSSEMNDLEASEDFFQKAVSLSRSLDYPYGLGWSLHHLAAYVYFVRGQFDLALSTMDEAGYFKKLAQCNHWGSAYLEAYIKTQLGERRKARKALDDLVEMVKPATRLAGLYFFLWAKISLDEQELDKADEYLRLALRIANQTGHPALNIWTRIEKSRYYRILGQPSVALPWAEDALGFSKRTNNYFQIGSALMEKAQANWEIGNLNTAEKDLLDARNYFEKINASYNHAYTAFLLSALYQNQHNSSEEKTYLEAAEQIIKGGFESILEKENQKAFPLIVFYIRNSSLKVREVTETILEKLSHIPPTPLHILGFGQFRVWQGKRLIPDHAWQRRKAGELFRYLLLQTDHSAPREILIETLWPDMPLNTATANFHQATSTLRHIFEADLPDKFPSRYFTIEGERVFLHIPVGSSVDFEIFETMLPPAILNRKIDELSNVLATYFDDLFPMDRYADWSTDKRSRLEELYISGLINLGELFYLYQEHFKAVDCCLKILKRDPWNEDAVLLAMKAYSSMNNAPRALLLYLELETSLTADLGIKPRSDLRNLVEEIRKR